MAALGGSMLFATPASLAAAECSAPAGFPNPQLLATMQRGANLPGWDATTDRPSIKQLKALRAYGFKHIRLPLDNNRLSGPLASTYIDAIYEQTIDLLSLGYTVSLDLHPDDAIGKLFATDRDAGIAALSEIWMPLARMAASIDPGKLALELLNEPQIGQEDWMLAAGKLVEVLRPIVPDHTIVVGPSGPQRHETLSGMQPLTDRNIIYAVHYYDPFLFTHQGANWGAPDDPLRLFKNLPFPASASDPAIRTMKEDLTRAGENDAVQLLDNALETPWNEAGIAQAFDTMAGWAKTHARPVVINEFGVLSFVSPRASRLEWLATVSRLAQARCLGWVHWDFKDGFGLIDPQTGLPDEGIMQALKSAD